MGLTSKLPIVAWSGIRPGNEKGYERHKKVHVGMGRAIQYRNATADVRNIFLNLLRCNMIVAHEAAMTFYRKNRFFISGDWSWETVVGWLLKIGPKNRAYISHIRLHTVHPPRRWESSDRHRFSITNALELPFARSPFLYRSLDPTTERIVESINHAVETFSRILRDTPHARPEFASGELVIIMSLNRRLLLGIEPRRVDRCDPSSNVFTMDLPNIMENICERMTDVDVIWTGVMYKNIFRRAKSEIESLWEIVSEEVREFEYSGRPFKLTSFVAKRKSITGLLFAAESFPSNNRTLE
jgi:hypothetical protein